MEGVKAFKGKGAFRQGLSTAEAFLKQIHDEMDLLSGQSRSIEKRPFYLEVHKPATASCYRAWKLRWRLAGERNGHTHWASLAPRMQRMSIAERDYYQKLNGRMLELNVLETIVRTQSKWMRDHLEQIGVAVPGSDRALKKLNHVQK
jgi:hypothetical protein